MDKSGTVLLLARELATEVAKDYPDAALRNATRAEKAESKLSIWRETLEKCMDALRSNLAEWTGDGELTSNMICVKKAQAALSAARELLEVNRG